MIVTELYDGQGLGNQLWSYVVTRTLALDRGLQFGIMSPEKFKGRSFLNLDFGNQVIGGLGPEGGPPIKLPNGVEHYFLEKEMWYEKYRCDIRGLDRRIVDIKDNTKIDGYFQSEDLILHRKDEIIDWLKVSNKFDCFDFYDENLCILNVRGGEYRGHPELLLTKKYWTDAISNMRNINSKLDFLIITDDVKYTKRLFPKIESLHFDIGKDYSIIKNSKYLILSNSSFSFFPAWTSELVKYVIAPKYWARHNISDGFWACEFNMYRDWLWQDTRGNIYQYDECISEYHFYKNHNKLDQCKPKITKKIQKNFFGKLFCKFKKIILRVKLLL
jgi:hypothetical protein